MYNILICDDDKDIVAALKIYLSSQEDYHLFEAYTGKQALEVVKHNDIQLILLNSSRSGRSGDVTVRMSFFMVYGQYGFILTHKYT